MLSREETLDEMNQLILSRTENRTTLAWTLLDKHDADFRAHVKELKTVCSEAYQLAGAVGAPVKALDNLAYASQGAPLPHNTFLPISPDDCAEVTKWQEAKLCSRCGGRGIAGDPKAVNKNAAIPCPDCGTKEEQR